MRFDRVLDDNENERPAIDPQEISDLKDILIAEIDSTEERDLIYSQNEFNLVVANNPLIKKDPLLTDKFFNNFRKRYYNEKPIYSISAYDAFYPENFYSYWEIFNQTKIIKKDYSEFLFCNDGTALDWHEYVPLGYMEATMNYCQDNFKYENNNYTHHSIQERKITDYDIKFGETHTNFLSAESFNIDNNIGLFDFVTLSFSNKDNFIDFVQCVKVKGSCIIYLQNPEGLINSISDILKHFRKARIVQPNVQNPLDYSIYLILEDRLSTERKYDEIKIMLNYRQILSEIKKKYLQDCYKYLDGFKYEFEHQVAKGIEWCQNNKLMVRSYYSKEILKFSPTYTKCNLPNRVDNPFPRIEEDIDYSFHQESLHKLKRELNRIKRYIDTKEQFIKFTDPDNDLIDWQKMTDCVSEMRNLRKIVSMRHRAEGMTNSWLKFYEILSEEGLFLDRKYLRSFHIGELPGAYILAFNHYLKTRTNVNNHDWTAQSLNPLQFSRYTNDSFFGDEFGMYKRYPNKWLFGEDNTGDITQKCNYDTYYKNLKDVDFITGDASLKLPVDQFNEQEGYLSIITLCQLFIILTGLRKGGTTLFKMFLPLAEPLSISSLYLLTMVFDNVSLIKPQTSHPGSSEIFVVCTGYTRMPSDEIFDRMINIIENGDCHQSIFPFECMEDFIEEYELKVSAFINNQMESIKRNLTLRDLYYNDLELQKNIINCNEESIDSWFRRVKIESLPNYHKILKKIETMNNQFK